MKNTDSNTITLAKAHINLPILAISFSLGVLLFSGNISDQIQLLSIGAAAKYIIVLLANISAFCLLFFGGAKVELRLLFLLITLKVAYSTVRWAFNDGYDLYYVDIVEAYCIESLALLLFTAGSDFTERFIIKICRLSLLIASIETILAFFIAYSKAGDFFGIKPMITIPWGGSHYISSILLLILTIYTALPDVKRFKTVLVVLGCSAIIFTRSTSGIVGLATLFVISNVRSEKFDLKTKLSLLILVGAVILIINSKIPGFFGRISNSYLSIVDKNYSIALNGRDQLYTVSASLIHERPILGYGPQYRLFLPNNTYAHNFILDELCRGGMIGLVISIAIIICAAKPLLSSSTYFASGVKCALVVSCIVALFEPTFNTLVFDFYFYLFLIPAYLWTNNAN